MGDYDIFSLGPVRIVTGVVFGLVFGSFITMLSYRLPRRLSIIKPSSQCPLCHTRLRPLDLIPVLSWVLTKGKCRHCKAPISPRYPLIELFTAAATAILFYVLGLSPTLLVALFTEIVIITAIVMKIER
ncbi:MAG: prepilin peptidase [Proteobacteria bacterium]|jgi:leader peptidase (prepilin peptidase)/N-methyltransferase|nr:prepilin peptidase [Alphaproteobacteria bacterium]NCC02491.1 prepilin peptidase [Pseudomonadota bacterium]